MKKYVYAGGEILQSIGQMNKLNYYFLNRYPFKSIDFINGYYRN